MKSLANKQDLDEILSRLSKLTPNSARQWGRMTPNQMLCHLNDSYLLPLSEREAAMRDNFFTRSVMKWLALQAPIQWPKGVKTGPTMDQEIGGTPPLDFETDRAQLEKVVRRFVNDSRDFSFEPHPIFGAMTVSEWMRWGYLHADHHFRQFGV